MLNGEITSTFLHKGWISISYKSTYCTVFTHLQHPSTSPPSTGPQLQWTSPSRLLSVGVGGAAAAAVAYTEVKRQHLNTAAECASSGIHFLPLVVETTGAWAPEAHKALNQIARSVALRRGEEASSTQARFFQEACVLVRTFRARAALRRRAALAIDSSAPSSR